VDRDALEPLWTVHRHRRAAEIAMRRRALAVDSTALSPIHTRP
jgi:hypothetical protein